MTGRLAEAERKLAEARFRLQTAGIDHDLVETVFAVLWDAIAEVKECREQARLELALAQYEWERANDRPPDPTERSRTATSLLMRDMPGFNLCPNPATVQTPAEFMDCLRKYRIWSGKVSYRVMERKCYHRFAASTICTTLNGNELPSFDMVQAIIVACGGSKEHQISFGSAWRRIQLQRDVERNAMQYGRPEGPHTVSGTV